MTPKQQAVVAYLSAHVRHSRVTLTEQGREYLFKVMIPVKRVEHRVRFDSREFDQNPLSYLLELCTGNEITKAIAIAPFALDITLRSDGVHASPRYGDF